MVSATYPASAVTLEDLVYDPAGDVINDATNQTVDRPGIDMLNMRVDDLSGDLEVSITLAGSPEVNASYTVNVLVDAVDLFTFSYISGSDFYALDPLGGSLTVLGWFDPDRAVWEVSTALLSVDTGLEVDSAYSYVTDSTGALLLDSFETVPPANDPPVVVISAPTEGARVSGVVTVSGSASDDTAVIGVYLRVDGGEWTEVTGTGTWSMDLDTTSLADGAHTIDVMAYDDGQGSSVATVHIDVMNAGTPNDPPVVRILRPVPASTIRGTVQVNGTATDDTAVTSVSVQVGDGPWGAATGTSEWSYSLDTTAFEDGILALRVKASDGQLESDVKETFFVVDNVAGSVYPMTITITNPVDRQAVSGIVNVTGTVSPGEGVANVYFRLGSGEWSLAKGYRSWYHEMDTGELSEGTHAFEAYAMGWGGALSPIATVTFWVGAGQPPGDLPPVVTVTDPWYEKRLTRTIADYTFAGHAFDDLGIGSVEARLDGAGEWHQASLSGEDWSLGLSIRELTPGADHFLQVRATDSAGQSSSVITAAFETGFNDPPEVDYTVVEKTPDKIRLEGTATDTDDPILRVEASFNGNEWVELEFTPSDGPPGEVEWSYSIVMRGLREEVVYTVDFRAYDGIEYSAIEEYEFVRVKDESGMNPKKAPGPGPVLALGALVAVSMLVALRRRSPRAGP